MPAAKATGLLAGVIESIENLPTPPPVQVKSMLVKEQKQLMKLIAKHTDDYESMSKDLVLNVNQLTAPQLQKRVQLLHRLQAL